MKSYLLPILLCLCSSGLFAQGFLKLFPSSEEGNSYVYKIKESPDKSLLIRANYNPADSVNFDFTKLDQNGQFIWNIDKNRRYNDDFFILDDNSYVAYGAAILIPGSISTQFFASRYDANGQLLWTNTYSNLGRGVSSPAFGAIQLADGLLIYGAEAQDSSTLFQNPYMVKLDWDGNQLWQLRNPLIDRRHAQFRLLNNNNDGSYDFVTPSANGEEVWTIDENGTIISQEVYFPPTPYPIVLPHDPYVHIDSKETVQYAIKESNHEIRFSIQAHFSSFYNPDTEKDEDLLEREYYLSKIAYGDSTRIWIQKDNQALGGYPIFKLPNNQIVWPLRDSNFVAGRIRFRVFDNDTGTEVQTKTIQLNNPILGISHVFRKNGYFFCAGVSSNFNLSNQRLIFFKLDDNLDPYDETATVISNANKIRVGDLQPTQDGGYAGTGTIIPSTGIPNRGIIFAFKADSNGLIFANEIYGNVVGDLNQNCTADSSDFPLKNWIVKAEGQQTFYATTDSLGDYRMQIDTGNYQLSILPQNDYWLNCDTANIQLATPFDTLHVDLQTRAISTCPFVEVDIGVGILRRCFNNQYQVRYCNKGTLAADNVVVEVELDPYLNLNTTSIPIFSQNGQTLQFDVGTLAVGECGSFSINVTPDCDSTVLGQVHCVEAHVTPDTLCTLPDSLWSGASIVVNGVCTGDSVDFVIKNIGTAPNTPDLIYIVIVDDLILRAGNFNLNPGDSIQFTEAATGVMRLEARQEPYHPGNSRPTITVAGCGMNGTGNRPFRFISHFYQNDGDPFTDIDCTANRGSYDPNDKAAQPVGSGAEHYIHAEDEINYKIRFQNTGTDTAFTVVITDTLSGFLDPASIRPGASSHDYVFSLTDNIVSFTFNQINLPDSTVDLVGSNGFVQFKIAQQADNAPRTRIENKAAIYFDFNPAIITNTTFHTIEPPLVVGTTRIDLCEGELYQEEPYLQDTVLNEFYSFADKDSIAIVRISALSNQYDSLDLTLLPGATYNNQSFSRDTSFSEIYPAQNGCDSIVQINITIDFSSSTNWLDARHWQVHPNPSNGSIRISSNQAVHPQTGSMRIYNKLGQLVHSQPWEPARQGQFIQLNLPSGTYVLVLQSEAGVMSKRLVIGE